MGCHPPPLKLNQQCKGQLEREEEGRKVREGRCRDSGRPWMGCHPPPLKLNQQCKGQQEREEEGRKVRGRRGGQGLNRKWQTRVE
jgi:hypothetical protein